MQNQTANDINSYLPIDFEECLVCAFHLDALSRSAHIDILALSGNEPSEIPPKEVGRLSAKNVHLFFLEPPAPLYPFLLDGEGISASGDTEFKGTSDQLEKILDRLPRDAKAIRFYFQDWNSFLYLAADTFTFSKKK